MSKEPADRAGEDMIDSVEERLKGLDLLDCWVVRKVHGGCMQVLSSPVSARFEQGRFMYSPERTAQHGSVRREVEQVSL